MEQQVLLQPMITVSYPKLCSNALLPQGKALTQAMREDVAWYAANFQDNHATESGWGHAYFCPHDGAFLAFDKARSSNHLCPICKTISNAPLHKAAWVYLYRYEAILSALKAAALYKIENKAEYLVHFKTIIDFYSEGYYKFVPHAKGPITSGKGKIAPQALNEAIFIVRIVQGLELLKAELSPEWIQSITQKLLLPSANFLDAQKTTIHNISCWINAAVGVVGLFCQNEKLIKQAFQAPLGLYDQVRQGVTQSYFWYEGSIHYDCFTLEALLNQLMLAGDYGKPIPKDIACTICKMVEAPFKMAFSNITLPNPNDGWPSLNLKTYSYIYEIAANLFKSSRLQQILQEIYESSIERTILPMSSPIYKNDYSLEWLLFSPSLQHNNLRAAKRASTCFKASDYAILRADNCEVFIKYGHCSSSHAHPDKMNIEVNAFKTVISKDLSNCGYAAPLCEEYHRTSVGHNTVVVDGKNHPTTNRGKCLAFNAEKNYISVCAREAYPNVSFKRSVQVYKNGFEDIFEVTSEQSHTYDYFFHLDGVLQTQLTTAPCSLGFSENGYQHLKAVQQFFPTSQQLELKWLFENGCTAKQALAAPNSSFYICKSYDNPVNKFRTTLIIRTTAKTAYFSQIWLFKKT